MRNDAIKWKHFPRYWSFVQGIHRSPVNSAHKGQCCGVLMFSLICLNKRLKNNREAGDLRRHCAHYDVIVMRTSRIVLTWWTCWHANVHRHVMGRCVIKVMIYFASWGLTLYVIIYYDNVRYVFASINILSNDGLATYTRYIYIVA